ncbi:aminotransferase-like domain-containing protein [Roseateles depolymerans]|uniref:aminotransferase-like domain-containing protein n=1 Tax=Roseateles depolymerans TaxID=76731 RepID=UPI00073D2FBA|nr:PLP-dependent aminotransferase family protein [Roseateles depolymerans]
MHLPVPRSAPDDAPAKFRYQALAAHLAQALRDGRFPPGARLPSVRELCETHGASLSTVTHALHRLEDAGLIEARARLGFFSCVAPDGASDGAETGGPPPTSVTPEALDTRRERLMALAAHRDGQLSLGHLGLPDDLLPLAALRRWTRHHVRDDAAALARGWVGGSGRLKQQLAQRLRRRGCEVQESDLVVTTGEGEALSLCLEALTRPGDAVAVTSPVPLRLLELLQSRGLRVLELGLPSAGVAAAAPTATSPVVIDLESRIQTDRPAVCIVDLATSALNGMAWDEAACRSLVALCTRHGLPLIECDLLGELTLRPDAPPLLKALDEADRVLHCGSTACVTGVGMQVGWVASGRHRVQLMAARAVHGELLPGLHDQVLADFLGSEDADRHLRRLRRQLLRRISAWTAAVLAHFPPGTTVQRSHAGHQLWVTLPQGLSAQRLLAQSRLHGISFVPGSVFTLGRAYDSGLRLTAACDLDATRREALARVGRLARGMMAP